MKLEPFQALINKNIIRAGTELTILRKGLDVGNNHITVEDVVEVEKINSSDPNNVQIFAHSTGDGKAILLGYKNIKFIDGMTPSRLCRAHEIRLLGNTEKQHKKRGRKARKRDQEE